MDVNNVMRGAMEEEAHEFEKPEIIFWAVAAARKSLLLGSRC